MQVSSFMEFLDIMEKLKCNTRHSWTSTGRHESVAEHCWRLGVMVLLLRDSFPEIDMDKVLIMSLIHDWGEAALGDIPSFYKNEQDEQDEQQAIDKLLDILPEPMRADFARLFLEMKEQKTPEARLLRALDMMEAVIQHNEAPLSTWLPLERQLNLVYGEREAEEFPQLRELRKFNRQLSEEKLKEDTKV